MAQFTDNPTLGKFMGDADRAERPTTGQRYAVAKIIGYCEAIAASGQLGDVMEARLRERIAETLSAFGMEPHQEAIKTEMERT